MHRTHNAFEAIFALVILMASACGQNRLSVSEQPSSPSVQIAKEITSPRIDSFAQDSTGHIWIGTFRGLNRHNAHEIIQYYSTGDETSLPNNEVFRLHTDRSGRLWVSTTAGIAYYTDKDDFHRPKNWDRTQVYQIAESPDGRVFFNDRSRIFEYLPENDSLTCVIRYKDSQSGSIRLMHFLGEEKIAIVWPDSVSLYDAGTYSYISSIPMKDPVSISAEGPSGKIWLGTRKGPVLLNPEDNSLDSIPEAVLSEGNLSSDPFSILQYDRNRTLFVNRDREIVMYDASSGKMLKNGDEDFPFMNTLDKEPSILFKDSDGNVWVSHRRAGYSVLWTYESGFNNNTNLVEQLSNEVIQSMSTGPGGEVWAASQNGSLILYEPSRNKVSHIPVMDPILGERVMQILCDSKGILYLSGTSGMTAGYSWDGERLHLQNLWDTDNVLTFMEDTDGTVWCGGFSNSIIALLEDGTMKRVPIYPEGGYYQISLMAKTGAGFLIGAHPTNIQVFDPETYEHHPLVDERTFKEVLKGNLFIPTCVFEDSKGLVWIGTDACGLLRYDPFSETFEEIKGAPCEDIAAIEEDHNGNIWVSSLSGIGVWYRNSGSFLNYKSDDGTGGNYFTDRCSASLQDGSMIFGGYHGITTVNPDDLDRQMDIPLNFEYLKVHNEIIAPGEDSPIARSLVFSPEVILKHNQNGFSISYSALDYRQSGKIRYSFLMEGVDDYWVEAGTTNEAYYSNLKSGKHLFRVKIDGPNGMVKPKEISLTVKVKPAPWLSWYAVLLYLLAGACILSVLTYSGIKARRSAEAAHKAEEEKEQEKRVNKMNMDFFANVAHEFRTPLTLISGPVSLLSASPNTDRDEKRLVSTIQKSVNRMLTLVNQMMDFNRLEGDALPLMVSEKDLVPILNDSVDIFREQAREKGISLEALFSEKVLPMPLDEDKVGKIMMNILSNAFKFTSEGGTVSVLFDVISSEEAHHTAPHPEGLPESGFARIRVSDTGTGVPEALLEKIFDRYFQVKDSGSGTYNFGTGIGLYYTKTLTELHHGTIWASNRTVGKGTVMTVLLPVDPGVYSPEEIGIAFPLPKMEVLSVDQEETAEEGTADKKTILVVDDDIDISSYLRDILSSDYRILRAHSADEALESMRKEYPDLVLSDVAMPGKDGYTLCREIKQDKDLYHLPVILVTAKTTVENQIQGLDSGADAYVTKPFDPFYLKSLIRSQLDNRDRLRSVVQTSTSTKEIDRDALSEQDSKLLADLYRLMESELSNPELDVEKMASSLYISRSKLFYKVKGLTGETPIEFFKQYKLSRAAELLKEGRYPISQISDMTGFSSPSKFSSLFKKRFGVPPSEYKG